MEDENLNTPPSKQPAVRRIYRYDIFYDIHGEIATATVMGYNIPDAKKRFKNIYGGWKITNVQRL